MEMFAIRETRIILKMKNIFNNNVQQQDEFYDQFIEV